MRQFAIAWTKALPRPPSRGHRQGERNGGIALRARSGIAALLLAIMAQAAVPGTSTTNRLLPVPEVRRDIMATAHQLARTYPALRSDGTLSAKLLAYARGLADRVNRGVPAWRALEDEDLVLNHLKGPHATLRAGYIPFSSSTLLPLGFYWAKGGLVVYRVPGTPSIVQTGDRVLKIGGLTQDQLLGRFGRYFAGKKTWQKALVGRFLPFSTILNWLGLMKAGRVQLLLQRSTGARYPLTLSTAPVDAQSVRDYERGQVEFADRFEAPPDLAKPHGSRFFGWRLTPDYGVFWLTQCLDTKAYRKAVDAFFQAVVRSQVHSVVIDLQNNEGGDRAVADALLAHLPIRAQYREDLRVPASTNDLFAGPVYVLTSATTFASAVDVAQVLRQAGNAVLVGEPTGWGNVRVLGMPERLGEYRVSQAFVTSPNGPVMPALAPSIPLSLTARDIQQGVNPVARWLRGLCTPHVKT